MKSRNSVSRSFTMLVCLYVFIHTGWSKRLSAPDNCIVIIRYTENFWLLCIRTQGPVQIFTEFFTGEFTKIYWWSVFLFNCTNNWHVTEDLYEFISAHLALFGREIALHKSCRVEWSTHFASCMFLCKAHGFWYS